MLSHHSNLFLSKKSKKEEARRVGKAAKMEEKKEETVNEVEEAKLPTIAAAIAQADAILVLTGAGMGVTTKKKRIFLKSTN